MGRARNARRFVTAETERPRAAARAGMSRPRRGRSPPPGNSAAVGDPGARRRRAEGATRLGRPRRAGTSTARIPAALALAITATAVAAVPLPTRGEGTGTGIGSTPRSRAPPPAIARAGTPRLGATATLEEATTVFLSRSRIHQLCCVVDGPGTGSGKDVDRRSTPSRRAAPSSGSASAAASTRWASSPAAPRPARRRRRVHRADASGAATHRRARSGGERTARGHLQLGADAVGMGRVRRRVSKRVCPAQGQGRERGENGAGQVFRVGEQVGFGAFLP